MAEAVNYDFKDEQGRSRPPTAQERWEIQKYLNDQHPLGNIPARRSTMTEETITEKPKTDSPYSRDMEKEMYGVMTRGMDEYQASMKREEAIRAAYAPRLEELRKGEEAEIRSHEANKPALPAIPEQKPVPTRGQYVDPTIGKSLFAVASLMAGLAMAGGRGRGMLAMAGLTGAMKGYNEGNQERYEAGLKEYKLQVEEQAKSYDEQYKNYMAILNSNRLSLEEKMQMYDLEAARQADELGKEAARQKNIDAMIKHAGDVAKFSYEAQKAAAAAEDLPSKRKHDEIMRASAERIAKIRENTALINKQKAEEKKVAAEKDKKEVEHLRGAIATEQRTLSQMLQEEKGLHGGMSAVFDALGMGSGESGKLKDQIKVKKQKIQEMQDRLNQMVLTGQVRDAVDNSSDIEVGEPLSLP